MSYDIFVTAFHEGAPASVLLSPIHEAFGEFVSEVDATHWLLRYDGENSCDVLLHGRSGSPECISGFSVHRPCGDQRFWDALSDILRLGPLTLYSDFPPLVSDMTVAQHLPPDMIEGLGSPVCVRSGDDILEVLQNA